MPFVHFIEPSCLFIFREKYVIYVNMNIFFPSLLFSFCFLSFPLFSLFSRSNVKVSRTFPIFLSFFFSFFFFFFPRGKFHLNKTSLRDSSNFWRCSWAVALEKAAMVIVIDRSVTSSFVNPSSFSFLVLSVLPFVKETVADKPC